MADRIARSIFKAGAAAAILLVIGAVAWLALQPAIEDKTAGTDLASEIPIDEFDRRVRDYLLRHPEVIVEAAQLLEQRQRTSAAAEIKALIASRSDEIFNDPDSPVGGNPQGDVTLVEFFDYNCPYCRRIAPVLIEAEGKDPDLRFVYKEWPILGSNSDFAARAALASRAQGKYVAFHKAMMQTDGVMDKDKVMETAQAVGLDLEKLKADMEDPALEEILERNKELARVLRITGTPSFVIGDQMLRGATDLGTIDGMVARARQADPQ